MNREPGQVTTFYSYMGGVGRTFILANVATILAWWGRRVLCLDWDLEAPGLRRYLAPVAPPRAGVLDLVERLASAGAKAEWRDLVHTVTTFDGAPGPGRLDMVLAGAEDDDYVARVQRLNWEAMRQAGLLRAIEVVRGEWVNDYDHVLIDSRTGITDIGGICAAQLPDVLVMVLTANNQSLDGTLQVHQRAVRARKRMPLSRGGFWSVPIPSRVHSGEEVLLEAQWARTMASRLGEMFQPWRDPEVPVESYLAHLQVREVARWSFGEDVPFLEGERLDDPGRVSYAIANIAALLDHRMEGTGELVENRNEFVFGKDRARELGTGGAGPLPIDVFISHPGSHSAEALELYTALRSEGLEAFVDRASVPLGSDWAEALYRARESSRIFVLILSAETARPALASELEHIRRLAKERAVTLVPVFLDYDAIPAAPAWIQGIYGIIFADEGDWTRVAGRIVPLVRVAKAASRSVGSPGK